MAKQGPPQVHKTNYGVMICYDRNLSMPFSVFNSPRPISPNALASSLPFFVLQLFMANVVYRLIFYATKFLHLPRFVAQILCGVLLGPSTIGETLFFQNYIFPYRYTMVLETFANLALVYYMFLLGLEIDLSLIKRSGTKALSISMAGIFTTFVAAIFFYSLVVQTKPSPLISKESLKGVFWAASLGATCFSDLVRTLSDLKLLRTETGKTAMSAALITDLFTWFHLILIISIFTKDGRYKLLAVATTFGFVLVSWFLARPALAWAISRTTKERNELSEIHIWFAFIGVVFFGLITDICGAHSIVGAFVFGVIMPEGHAIRNTVEEKLGDFVSAILMPLFYITSGLRTDFKYMFKHTNTRNICTIILGSCATKIVSTYVVSLFYSIPWKDGLALGILMNTKGILSLIIINAGRDMNILDNKTFPLMVMVLLVMSCLTKPILSLSYKVNKVMVQNKHRSMEKIMKQETEFRILACIHNLHNVSGITSLLEASNPTPQSPIYVYAIHLVELTARTAASLLIMNDEYKNRWDSNDSEANHIANAFQFLKKKDESITAQTITIVSPFTTMHEDICNLAEEKRITFIILPFHKQLNDTSSLGEEKQNQHLENINLKVLKDAPCSVGVLVDRGLMGITRKELQQSLSNVSHGHNVITKKQVIMFFLGGPDDREALSYAWRMAENPNVNLTVVKFEMSDPRLTGGEDRWESEKQKDDDFLYDFTFKTMNQSAVTYKEQVVNDGAEVIHVIRQIENHYDLCITGRGETIKSPLLKGLSDWDTCPELGIFGDVLVSSNFLLRTSVLVLQQHSVRHDQDGKFAGAAPTTMQIGANPVGEDEPFMCTREG